MKKGLMIIGLVIAVVCIYFLFFNNSNEKKGEEAPKMQALVQGKNSEAFNQPFNAMLDAYFTLKTSFVNWDTAAVDSAANMLVSLGRKVPYDALKADTTIIATAKSFSESVSAEALGMVGEPAIEGKRRSFYTLSENLYNLLRTVQYDQQIIYHDKCPMAFNDSEEAYWVSNSKEIVNPYLGKKHPRYAGAMSGCGSVEDSIDYRNK